MVDEMVRVLMSKGFSQAEAESILQKSKERGIEEASSAFFHLITDIVKSATRRRIDRNGKISTVDGYVLLNNGLKITVWDGNMLDKDVELLVNRKAYFSIRSVKIRNGAIEYTGEVLSEAEIKDMLGFDNYSGAEMKAMLAQRAESLKEQGSDGKIATKQRS